jgi:hypothetical protein
LQRTRGVTQSSIPFDHPMWQVASTGREVNSRLTGASNRQLPKPYSATMKQHVRRITCRGGFSSLSASSWCSVLILSLASLLSLGPLGLTPVSYLATASNYYEDDYYAADDGNNYGNNAGNQQGDDAAANNGDDASNSGGDDASSSSSSSNSNSESSNYYENYLDDWKASNLSNEDDQFHWSTNDGFDGVSIMPISCVN